MTDATIAHQLQVLTSAVLALVCQDGKRITRAELCERQGMHRNTLLARLQRDASFPRPGPDGKWALADVLRWEMEQPVLRPETPGSRCST